MAWLVEVSQRKREDAQASAKGDEQPGQTPRHLKTRGLIARDLGRTCSGVGGAFAVEGSIEQNELRQVLEALSFFNSEFGYVQGLSFVAATLLRHTALVTQLSKMLRLFFLSFCLSCMRTSPPSGFSRKCF